MRALAHQSFLLHDKVGSCSDGGEDDRTYNKVLHGIAFPTLLLLSFLDIFFDIFFSCNCFLLIRCTFSSTLESLKGCKPVLEILRLKSIAREVLKFD